MAEEGNQNPKRLYQAWKGSNTGGKLKRKKSTLKMGNKFGESEGISLPEILQNLHYDELEGNSKGKEGVVDFDIQPSPFIFEPEKRDEEIIARESKLGIKYRVAILGVFRMWKTNAEAFYRSNTIQL